ncbi:MAG: hypothetical protein V5A28_11560 [Haloarculaceae archaeon]
MATSVGFAVLLGRSVGTALSGALAVATAAAFAASLRLVDRDRGRPAKLVLAGTLALVVGAGFVASVGLVALGRLGSAYPVATLLRVRTAGLEVVSATAVAFGATLATVGGVASIGATLRPGTARAYADLAVKTFVVPLSLTALFVAPTLLAGPAGAAPTLGELFAGAVGLPLAVLGRLALPQGAGTHLLSLAALVAATAASLGRALAAAPLPDLLSGERRERWGARTGRTRVWLRAIAALAGTTAAVGVVELVVSQETLAGVLGGFYGVLTAVTNAVALRLPLVVVLLASLAVWTVGGLLGRTVRADAREVAARLGPFLGGVAVAVVAVLAHGVVLDPALSAVAERLPGAFGTTFDRQATRLVAAFGSAVVALAVAAGLVALPAVFALVVTVATNVGALHGRATGPTLAAVGLFVASGFGPGAGVDPVAVLAGLVGSFLVWDAGEYGTALAREVERRGRTGRPELAHLGATLAVGCVLAGLAWTLHGVAVGAALGEASTFRLAFVAVVAGIVLLVATLR